MTLLLSQSGPDGAPDPSSLAQEFLRAPSVEIQLQTVAVNLLLAAALGLCLRWFYVRYGRSLSNRRSFAANFVMLACTTTLIITVVKSSLALSLGLVGALSIVRFRSAIKEPEELAYLFLTIAVGLGLGADQRWVTLAALAIILALLWLSGRVRRGEPEGQALLLTVAGTSLARDTLPELISVLGQHTLASSLRRLDEGDEAFEAGFHVVYTDVQQFLRCKEALQQVVPQARLSFLDNSGIHWEGVIG